MTGHRQPESSENKPVNVSTEKRAERRLGGKRPGGEGDGQSAELTVDHLGVSAQKSRPGREQGSD